MAVNKRIDQLPTGTEVNSSSILPVWNNNATEGINIDVVSDYMVGDLESVVYRTNQLLSGGASFLSGLTYDVTSLEYLINGEIYATSTSTTVTTSTGDTTYDRIDLIIADTNGDVTILEGTASENPVQPDVDETTQIVIAIITVPVGATVIPVEETLIYDENTSYPTEWSGTTSTGTINLDYTTYTKSGSKSIFFNVVPNLGQTTFRSQTPFDTTTQNTIRFWIRNTVAWTTQQRLNIRLQNATGTNIGSVVQLFNGKYGFAVGGGSVGVWQLISIPIADFNLPTSIISRIQFQSSITSGVGLSCIIDLIKFVEGSVTNSQTNKWWYVRGNTSTTITPGSLNSTLRLEGVNNINSYASGSNKILFDLNPVITGLTSVEATTFYGDGSNLTGINVNDGYWTGGTGTNSIQSVNQSHTVSGNNSFIGGGQSNSVTTAYSAVIGGRNNTVDINGYSTIIGGLNNTVNGTNSSIIGGLNNSVSGSSSVIIGGENNTMEPLNNRSIIIGGSDNIMLNAGNSNNMFIAGSVGCIINSNASTSSIISSTNSIINSDSINSSIIGGESNLINDRQSFIGGGRQHLCYGYYSSIIGGESNRTSENYASVVGGKLNLSSGKYSTVIGGQSNSATTVSSAVIGGTANVSGGVNSFIGGGQGNNISAQLSAVIGGVGNVAGGKGSFIGGGGYYYNYTTYGNTVNGNNSGIIGGEINRVDSTRSGIIGGYRNLINDNNAFIGGGDHNKVSGIRSSIIGGRHNLITSSDTVILGCEYITGSTNDTVYVPYLNINQIDFTTTGVTYNPLVVDNSGNVLKVNEPVPLRYKALLSNTYTEQISGELVIGKEYVAILNGSDNFSNVGYVSDGVVFEATGTTPTYWEDGSVVYDIETNQPTEIIALLNSIGVDVEVGFLIGLGLGFFFNSDGKFLEDKLFHFPIPGTTNFIQRVDDEKLFLYIGGSYNKLPIFFEVYP